MLKWTPFRATETTSTDKATTTSTNRFESTSIDIARFVESEMVFAFVVVIVVVASMRLISSLKIARKKYLNTAKASVALLSTMLSSDFETLPRFAAALRFVNASSRVSVLHLVIIRSARAYASWSLSLSLFFVRMHSRSKRKVSSFCFVLSTLFDDGETIRSIHSTPYMTFEIGVF